MKPLHALLLAALLGTPWTLAQAQCGKPARERGLQVFETKCAICHSADRRQGHQFGPNLGGVLGRPIGKARGFEFSKPLGAASGTWSAETLQNFLEAPSIAYPGTAMAFGGLTVADDRSALVCFLGSRK